MRRILLVGLLLLAALPAVGCSSNDSGHARERVTALRGRVTSAADAPIAGVMVTASGQSALTDANGRYDLRVPAGEHLVRFEKNAFVSVVARLEVVSDSPTQRDVKLLARATAVMLDATTGGNVSGMRNAKLTAPASAFVTRTGAAVTGMVEVSLTPIDPAIANERLAASGDFTAVVGGTTTLLESFGMLDIDVRQGGEPLQVAAGKELEIRLPATASSTDAMQPLWSFDETTGRWRAEGMAERDAATGTYVARITHMSLWNLDKPALAACICGIVKERGSDVLPGARVRADGVSYFGTSEATTAADGTFCINVRRDSDVDIVAYHASTGGTQRRVRSNDMMSPIPPVRGAAYCVDGGVWEVERDIFRSSTGETRTCSSVSTELAAQAECLRGYGQAWGCYDAMGACTQHTGVDGLRITYANGAHMEATATTPAAMRFYASSGSLCMTMTEGATEDALTVTTASGTMYQVESSDTTGTVVTCPSGERVMLTGTTAQTISACSNGGPSGSSGMSTMCTPEGGVTEGTPCPRGNECDGSAFTCCRIPAAGMSLCLSAMTCAAAMGG